MDLLKVRPLCMNELCSNVLYFQLAHFRLSVHCHSGFLKKSSGYCIHLVVPCTIVTYILKKFKKEVGIDYIAI